MMELKGNMTFLQTSPDFHFILKILEWFLHQVPYDMHRLLEKHTPSAWTCLIFQPSISIVIFFNPNVISQFLKFDVC